MALFRKYILVPWEVCIKVQKNHTISHVHSPCNYLINYLIIGLPLLVDALLDYGHQVGRHVEKPEPVIARQNQRTIADILHLQIGAPLQKSKQTSEFT